MESSKRIDAILSRLDLLQEWEEVDKPMLSDTINTFIALRDSASRVDVGFFGPSGSGKSTLMNRILGCDIMPASSGGVSCTNTILKALKDTSIPNGSFKVTIYYFDEEELAEMLHFGKPAQDDEAAASSDEEEEVLQPKFNAQQKLTKIFLKDMWGKDVPQGEPSTVLDLVPREFHDIFTDASKSKQSKMFDDEEEAQEFIASANKDRKRMYLIKHLEVRAAFPLLNDQMCLLDIPGSGDTIFLNNLQRQGLDQSDLVVIVESQTRVCNGEVMTRLEAHAHMFQKKLGFALCMTKSATGLREAEKKHMRKRARMMVTASEETTASLEPDEQQDEDSVAATYLRKQKEQFLDALNAASKTVRRKLRGMEIFMLENGDEDEPAALGQEWNKLNVFLNQIVHKPVACKIIDGNIEAAIRDAKSRLKKPLVDDLPTDCIRAIQRIVYDPTHATQRPNFMLDSDDNDMVSVPKDWAVKRSSVSFINTLKACATDTEVKFDPPVKIWDIALGASVNMALLSKSAREFREEHVQRVEDITVQVRRELETRGFGEEKIDFCVNRLKGFLSSHLSSDMTTSAKLLKQSRMENRLAAAFWADSPIIVKGRGMAKKNTGNIQSFLTRNLPMMKLFIQNRLLNTFVTLDDSLRTASDKVGNLKTWLLKSSSSSMEETQAEYNKSIDPILKALDGVTIDDDEEGKMEVKIEHMDDDYISPSSSAGAAVTSPVKAMLQRNTPETVKLKLLHQLDITIQAKYSEFCSSLLGQGFRLRQPSTPPAAWFYVAYDKTHRDRVKVGYDESKSGYAPLKCLFNEKSRLPQLCSRIVQRLFHDVNLEKGRGRGKARWYETKKSVLVEVVQLVHKFVEDICEIWSINV